MNSKKEIVILQKEDPRLRKISAEVEYPMIKSKKMQEILSSLKLAIDSQSDAVAISAVQIGELSRIFLISKKIFNILEDNKKPLNEVKKDLIFINPKITKLSKAKAWGEEGCLSVRFLYGKVNRSTHLTIEALDENGNKIIRNTSGLLAQIIQHENDHLNGVLFIDKAIEIQEILPENLQKI
ncbi:MAG: peptide deformylase [Minisyncoccia bacterium]